MEIKQNRRPRKNEMTELLFKNTQDISGSSADERIRAILVRIRQGVLVRELGRFAFGAVGVTLGSLFVALIGLLQGNSRK